MRSYDQIKESTEYLINSESTRIVENESKNFVNVDDIIFNYLKDISNQDCSELFFLYLTEFAKIIAENGKFESLYSLGYMCSNDFIPLSTYQSSDNLQSLQSFVQLLSSIQI